MTYKIKLPIFEGPLDLLLYLIKKEEVDIYDIPISKITEEYLEYLEMLKLLDLNIAGEFLVMAATLMHIKSKMLLPQDPKAEEEEIEEDPRAELVKRLIEYKKFKDAAGNLAELEHKRKTVFPRKGKPENMPELENFSEDEGFEANIFDLITAFVKVVKNFSKEDFHKVAQEEYTVSQKIHDLYHLLVERPVVYFTDLFRKARTRIEAITIFLALLELIRLNEIIVKQKENFSEIEITRNPEGTGIKKRREANHSDPGSEDEVKKTVHVNNNGQSAVQHEPPDLKKAQSDSTVEENNGNSDQNIYNERAELDNGNIPE